MRLFKHKYTEEELRALIRKVEYDATTRGVVLGYEFAKSGGEMLYIPDGEKEVNIMTPWFDAVSSSGRTLDFESKNLGSNPNSAILKE